MVSKSVFILYWAFEIPLFSFWLFWGMNQHLCITMSINWPLCDLIHWDLFGLVPSKYEGNSTGASLFFFTHKKRTAKIFWYPSNTSTAHITDMLRLTTFGGNDAKLDRFLKRLEGAASHFGSPPQIRMARPGVFTVHLFLDLGEEMQPNSKSTLRLKSKRWSQPELSTSLPQQTWNLSKKNYRTQFFVRKNFTHWKRVNRDYCRQQ